MSFVISFLQCSRSETRTGHFRETDWLSNQASGRVWRIQPYQEPRDAKSSPHARSYLQVIRLGRHALSLVARGRVSADGPIRGGLAVIKRLCCLEIVFSHKFTANIWISWSLSIIFLLLKHKIFSSSETSNILVAVVRRKVAETETRLRQIPSSVTGIVELFIHFHPIPNSPCNIL